MSLLPQEKIYILLVDDHALVRNGVARLLADETDMVVVGEASSGEEALAFIGQVAPDIILMDARMPGIGGIEATRRIRGLAPQIRIIAMSSITSGVIPSQMLRAGAQAFISKNVGVDEMLQAIRMVQQGQHYVTPEVARQLPLDPFNDSGEALFDRLSRRELQIAMMLTSSKKVSQIATYLALSPKTVYSYRYRIFEKLGIRSDVELTVLAVQHGLADDASGSEDFSLTHYLSG